MEERRGIIDKEGINWFWEKAFNLINKKKNSYEYKRQKVINWNINCDEYFLLTNINIIDVDRGRVSEKRAILVYEEKIKKLLTEDEVEIIKEKYPIKKVIDGEDMFLIPGLSDLHCHISFVNNNQMGLKEKYYFDAQRIKNCEEAIKRGCTFVRDCWGTYEQLNYLKEEIKQERLLGPKIMTPYLPITPKGGMWDFGKVVNKFMVPSVFGGRYINPPKTTNQIKNMMQELNDLGCDFFKFYFEDKPLYGNKDKCFNMFSLDQAILIRKLADKYGKMIAVHSTFRKGSKRAIAARFDTIEHSIVDGVYSSEEAKEMARNNIAVIPTMSVATYLSMNYKNKGYYDNDEVRFFADQRKVVRCHIENNVINELQNKYYKFLDWLDNDAEERSLAMIGKVYPERVHGLAYYMPENIRALREGGVKIGIGTDGGTQITFPGNLEIEFDALKRYGYSNKEILRMATIGNMEILSLDKKLGSIEQGKYADMILLKNNPLEDVKEAQNVKKVFKNGRLYYQENKTS